MTHPDPKCPVCKMSMDEGFVVDKGHHSTANQAEWVKGKPEKSRWGGLDVKGRESHAIVTFRCSKCGWLVNFAP